KRAYCLKIQPATGSFARNLIYSTKPANKINRAIHAHNVLVKQAEEALSGIKPLESYLSVIVADEVGND
ncbi:hypothetical protein KXZ60_26415, partial [Klebsiella pneumoniae]|nr:hypothetical protein [Klebsiella pneumoniae]